MTPRARGQGWHRVLRVWVRSTSKHPPSAGGGSTEKRSWKLGKKKTVRSARLSCARRIPFSPPIFPRNGSKLHEAPLPSGSGGGRAGRRPAPCSARAQPLLTPLLAEPPRALPALCCAPSPSGCTSTFPGITGLCTRTRSWWNSGGTRCPVLPVVPEPCTHSGARLRLLHEQRHLGTPAPPRPPAQGGGGCCFLAPGPAGAGWRPGAGGEAEKRAGDEP